MSKITERGRITFYLPAALKAETESSAAKLGQTLSVWIERACREHLGNRPERHLARSTTLEEYRDQARKGLLQHQRHSYDQPRSVSNEAA